MGRFKQGKYKPKNTEKYVGNINEIVYRSSWEFHYMKHLDLNPNVLNWNSEGFVIPYFYPVDNKMHKYYMDMVATYRQKDGTTKTFLVEIKPYAETKPPVMPKRKTEKSMIRYKNAVLVWEKNKAKWQAAQEFCNKNNMTFVILTENELFKN